VNPKTALKLKTPDASPTAQPGGETAVSSADYLFHLMVVIARQRDAELDRRLAPLALNVGRYRTLATIDAFGPCTMSTFASHSPLDRTTNSRTVDQLVRAGWVARAKSSEDRRQIYIALTREGRALFDQARAVVSAYNDQLVDGLDDELMARLIAGQLMLADKVERNPGKFVDREASTPRASQAPMTS
jgi:DNA-binding MarR family transcriptional regulator